MLDTAEIQSYIASTCDGKSTCSLEFNSETTGINTLFLDSFSSYPSVCNSGSASVMVSVGCTLSDVQMSDRQVQGLLVGCIFVSVALFVTVYIDYIK